MKRPRLSKPTASPAGEIGVSDLKTRCLAIVEDVRERGSEYIVTKRGEPVARLVPMGGRTATLQGALRGQIEIDEDIVSSDWSQEFEALRD